MLPLALFLIFLILYFQFKQVPTTLLVFSGIIVAWAGGFLMIWAYGQDWFLDFAVFGVNMRDLFQVHTINLSVAIWVGFLALFGIASDDGVVITTYLDQSFGAARIETVEDARAATLEAGMRRVRPCLMTTATTILALIPVLTSTGKGSDIMVPMAIPSFGGMLIEVMTMLVVPVVYCAIKEFKIRPASATSCSRRGRADMVDQLTEALLTSTGMLWKAFWGLVFGYIISSAIQVLIHDRLCQAPLPHLAAEGPRRSQDGALAFPEIGIIVTYKSLKRPDGDDDESREGDSSRPGVRDGSRHQLGGGNSRVRGQELSLLLRSVRAGSLSGNRGDTWTP